jgi:hypothetical protein
MTLIDDLDMAGSDATRDLRAVLSFFPLTSLEKLRSAQDGNRLVRSRYRDAEGRGCLLYFLGDITSKPALMSYPFAAPDDLLTARRLVRHWDSGAITDEALRETLALAIEQRKEVNRQEEEAIGRASQPLQLV